MSDQSLIEKLEGASIIDTAEGRLILRATGKDSPANEGEGA